MCLLGGGYASRIAVKLGLQEPVVTVNRTQEAWDNSLIQLPHKPDIVFIGDSLTYHCDFQSYFPDHFILNLGVRGNSIKDVLNRCEILAELSPKKIFLQIGINGLKEGNFESSLDAYSELIEKILGFNNSSSLYLLSMLPVTEEYEQIYTDNNIIRKFNLEIEQIANENDLTYIDIYSLYEVEGYLDENLTIDGIHLKEDAYTYWINKIEYYVKESLK